MSLEINSAKAGNLASAFDAFRKSCNRSRIRFFSQSAMRAIFYAYATPLTLNDPLIPTATLLSAPAW